MPGRELPEDGGKLFGGEGFNLFGRRSVFGDFDILRGILWQVLAKVAGIDKGFFEHGANARYGGAGETVLLGVIQELLEHLRPDRAKLAIADGRTNVILKDGTIGADSILVCVDTHILGKPLQEKLRDRLLRRLDVAAVDFERDKSTSIGCLGFLSCSATRDFLALSGFTVADLDGVIPFRASLSDVGHGDSSFPANSQALADLIIIPLLRVLLWEMALFGSNILQNWMRIRASVIHRGFYRGRTI